MLTAPVAALVVQSLLLLAPAGVPYPADRCAVVDSHGRCLVAALDPGRPGGPAVLAPGPTPARHQTGPRRAPVEPDPPPLRAIPIGGTGSYVGRFDPNGLLAALIQQAPAAAAPVDTGALARRATSLLTIAPPVMRMSADGKGFVGLPLWLWIDTGTVAANPTSATAAAGAAQVTAVGRLSGVEWSMGPPGAMVRCTGPGARWTGQPGASPDCGYTYTMRSLPERTGGTGRWTVAATAIWTVTWSGVNAGAPVAGQDTLRLTSQMTLPVGEVQVLTGGGQP